MRRGLTLLEVLLVLGLLVVVAAMAAPSVGITLDSGRLRGAADQVRTELAKGRVKAMSAGKTFAFRYQPGGSAFVLAPWYTHDDYLESSTLTGANPNLGPNTAAGPGAEAAPGRVEQLPEGVTFAGGETDSDMRAIALMQNTASAPSLDGEWSQPIFFYPDGTSSTARLAVINQRQRYVMLTLRGLTGVVRVGRPTSGELTQ